MRCEVCGRKIHDNPNRVIIEGAKLTVCSGCAKHGKVTWEEPAKPKQEIKKPVLPTQGPIQIKKKDTQIKVDVSQELVTDYAEIIRKAREKSPLTHEELGKRINEKASVLRKIETGKMEPNNILIVKLEHELKIKLLIPVVEEEASQNIIGSTKNELTLGDIIQRGKNTKQEGQHKRRL